MKSYKNVFYKKKNGT